ncbi:hypothetical protein ACHAO7_010086 [Fusarium culmorum]
MPRKLLSNNIATSSLPTTPSRIKDKFTSKKSTETQCNDINVGNSNTPPNYASNNPFLDIRKSQSSCNAASELTLLAANEKPPPYESNPKASNLDILRSAPSIPGITSAEDKYAFLSTFDTVFVIDDSGSMAGRSWGEVQVVLRTIAPICTSHDPDGIDIYFLNHRSSATGSGTQAPGGYYHYRNTEEVSGLFAYVCPSGSTPTGTRLQSILNPYISHIASPAANIESTKPINIIVITDGAPSDDPEAIIVTQARKLDQIEAPPHQVGIQFFQVGNVLGATKALRELDDDLANQGIRDMVDTTTWNSTTSGNSPTLSAEEILKVVLGAVVRRFDRRATHGTPQGRAC